MQPIKNKMAEKNNIIPFIPEGDFYFTKGVEAFRKRKFDIALKWLQKAVDTVPNEPLYKCQMSIIYTEIGMFHKANQLLTNVLQATGDKYMDCYYLLANNYAHLGLLSDAKKYAESYLDKEPNGDFKEEAESLLELIQMEDEDWDPTLEMEDELLIYQETVFYHIENMEWEKAIVLLDEMLTLFPEHKTAMHEYAYVLFFAGHQQEALQIELDLLSKDPDSLYSHANLALFYYEMNDTDRFGPHIRSLYNVYPIHEQQKLKIAVTMARTGFYEEAYERFLQLDKGMLSGHASYYRWFSLAAHRMGHAEKAMLLWEEGCKRHANLLKEEAPWNQ